MSDGAGQHEWLHAALVNDPEFFLEDRRERRDYRNGTKPRTLTARVGILELLVPQDRDWTFSTELCSRYQRTEQALVLTLMEMHVQGVSTRKVAAITERLCGMSVTKCHVSTLAGRRDGDLAAWRERPLTAPSHSSNVSLLTEAHHEPLPTALVAD